MFGSVRVIFSTLTACTVLPHYTVRRVGKRERGSLLYNPHLSSCAVCININKSNPFSSLPT